MAELDLQKSLLDYASRQTLSHGAMLFAGSSSSFSFLRIIERHASISGSKSILFIPISFLVLYVLLAFTIYVIFRILYYGVLVSQTFSYRPLPTHNNLAEYQDYITNFDDKNSDDKKIGFRSGRIIQNIYSIFGIGLFNRRVFWSFLTSAIISNLLFLAFNVDFVSFFSNGVQYHQILYFSFLFLPLIVVLLARIGARASKA